MPVCDVASLRTGCRLLFLVTQTMRAQCTICIAAHGTGGFFGTGSCTAGTVCFIEMGITAVNTFMIMFIVFLCPFTCCLVIVGIQISILNAADLTDRFLGTGSRTTGMLTAIAALKAYTTFPFVRVLRYNGRITAIIYRTVCGRCLDPGDNTCVVSWIESSVSFPAFCTDSLIYTGGRTTGACF